MTLRLALVLAALMGANGVSLAALGAHAAPAANLASASQMLLFHALAVLATVALSERGLVWRGAAAVAVAGWLIGSGLFAGDITLRAFAGQRLFPMAAPLGGSLLIGGWLALVVAALRGQR